MIKSPLGTDEKIWQRNMKELKKNRWWKKGYKGGLKGQTESDNPYKLSPDVLELLRKKTFWLLGLKDAEYSDKLRHQRKKQNVKDIKKAEKDLKKKNKVVKEKKHGKRKHKHSHS